MEIVTGFLLWIFVDVMGIKAIRRENTWINRITRFLIMLVLGFIGIALYFMAFGGN